ncbi:MAG: hypothetical protein ACI8YQ_002253 [Polaribacter sp.]|jgi:hypothetical protein
MKNQIQFFFLLVLLSSCQIHSAKGQELSNELSVQIQSYNISNTIDTIGLIDPICVSAKISNLSKEGISLLKPSVRFGSLYFDYLGESGKWEKLSGSEDKGLTSLIPLIKFHFHANDSILMDIEFIPHVFREIDSVKYYFTENQNVSLRLVYQFNSNGLNDRIYSNNINIHIKPYIGENRQVYEQISTMRIPHSFYKTDVLKKDLESKNRIQELVNSFPNSIFSKWFNLDLLKHEFANYLIYETNRINKGENIEKPSDYNMNQMNMIFDKLKNVDNPYLAKKVLLIKEQINDLEKQRLTQLEMDKSFKEN